MEKHIQLANNDLVGVIPPKERLLEGEIALNNNVEAPMLTTIGSDGNIIQVGVGRHQVSFGGGYTLVGEAFNYITNKANGGASHAEGVDTIADGDFSHAEGSSTQANGISSHAEGNEAKANGSNSHAEGDQTKSNGNNSHAEGSGTIANGDSSHAEGINTIANNVAEHASGNYNKSISGTSQEITALTADAKATLFSIGNGTDNITRRNALEVKWNGDAYFSGDTKFAKTINIGSGNTITGQYAFAQGSGCTASSNGSHAEGFRTQANGTYSHAEGINTIANGSGSHAEGSSTQAIGYSSHVEGINTIANYNGCHAEGQNTTANGSNSHTEGYQTIASGNSSHAEGHGTIANNNSEHASGAFNISISGTNQEISALTADTKATLFSIGNGDGEANKRNALEVKWNGDAYFSGDIYIMKNGVKFKLQDLF